MEPVADVHVDVGHFRSVASGSSSIAPGLRQHCQRPMIGAWVEFLKDYEWQWFATLTFKDAVHPEAAGKRFNYWTRLLDDSNGVPCKKSKTHPKRVRWARGLEWQKRDVLHFHAVMGNVPTELDTSAYRDLWARTWLEIGRTGYASIFPVEKVGGVVGYIAKYCAKGGEIDLSPSLGLVQSLIVGQNV
jgi:hypothetical protein